MSTPHPDLRRAIEADDRFFARYPRRRFRLRAAKIGEAEAIGHAPLPREKRYYVIVARRQDGETWRVIFPAGAGFLGGDEAGESTAAFVFRATTRGLAPGGRMPTPDHVVDLQEGGT